MVGRQSIPSQTTRYTRLDSVSAADQEGLVRMKVSSLTGSGTVAYARIETRADATYANYYRYQVQFNAGGAIDVLIRKQVSGTASTLRNDASVITAYTTSDWVWLRWKLTNSGSDVALTYKLWKDGTSEPGSFATTYTDVAPGSTYTSSGRFEITSQALAGFTGTYPYLIDYDDLSIATVGTTADTTAPTVPTSVAASPAGAYQIDLTWTASTDTSGVYAYKVYRGGSYLATTGSTSWSDTGLTASTAYSYTVSAIDGTGNESAQSSAAALTTTPAGATTYTYDVSGNKLTAASGAQTVRMTYDRLNRIVSVDDPDLGTSADTTYTYSLTSPAWTDPSGSYGATFDKFERATAVNDPINASDFTWTYRADGQPATFGQPNGNTTALDYDALGRLTSKDTTATGPTNRALYDWTYNRAGQILTEAETITGSSSNGTVTYGYDALARLTSSTLSGTTTTYGWEAVPNRSSVQVGGGSTATTSYDVANRPTTGTNPTATYTSNDDGQLTSRPSQTLEWDHLGRLTAVKDAAGTTTLARFTYDPLDRLVVIEHPGIDRTRLRYVGPTTNVVQWLDDIAGTVTRSVANGWSGERLQDWTGSGSNLRTYGDNAHHDTTWLASSTGTVSQSLRYDPWGMPRTAVPSGYSPFQFQASWRDTTVDLSWAATRWYAPALGRFVSEDSLLGDQVDPPSRHMFAYGEGEPVSRVDFDGRYWMQLGANSLTLSSIAFSRLGNSSRWPMLVHANRALLSENSTAAMRLRAHSWIYVPSRWLFLQSDRQKFARPDDRPLAPYALPPKGKETYSAISPEWRTKMHDAQKVSRLGDYNAAFSFTADQLKALVDRKSDYRRPRYPSAADRRDFELRLWGFNGDAKRWAAGTQQRFLDGVWLVRGRGPDFCEGRPCTIGQYIFLNGNPATTDTLVHEYIHVVEWEGRGDKFGVGYALARVLMDTYGAGHPDEAPAYLYEAYFHYLQPWARRPWFVWFR